MDASTNIKPKTIAEMLPDLTGILSKDAIQTLTAKKQPRSTIAHTLTSEKVLKPMTIAEMRTNIMSLKARSPKKFVRTATSTKKKTWNSSVKVEGKTVSHTANGQMKHNPAKKMLNFQPKTKAVSNVRATMVSESPKFPKPEFRVKKSLALQARNNVRISGISHIPETPIFNKPVNNRMILANKENIIVKQPSAKKMVTPKPAIQIRIVPDTPLTDESCKSSCDASFLQKEKEINEIEEKIKAIADERTLENIAEITPPISTPFKEYRSVQEYFNNSSDLESSAIYNNNTIMCFEKPTDSNQVLPDKREESVIVSLCDLLNKATVNNNSEKMSTEIDDLLQIKKQTEHNIKMIENSICALNSMKESQLKSLHYVSKLISEKRDSEGHDKTLTDTKEISKAVKTEKISPETSAVVGKPCSVIKSCLKSPSYKIPKKNLCLRKKVFYKSMPNVSSDVSTPVKSDMGNRALGVYLKMKEHMNFLNTPVAKPRRIEMCDTPAVTSHNLQQQLDKLYGEI